MTIFRVASREYAPDNSEGARLYGGRWNVVGTPAIYAAATRSLASLEVIAHQSGIPALYQIVAIEVPDDVTIQTVEDVTGKALPDGWRSGEELTQLTGSLWADGLTSAVLRVPSAIYPNESNYILNPRHSDFARISFRVTGERIDPRLYAR